MKRALIFGATGGIGQAIAARLAESGWSMYLHCNSNWEEASDLARTLAEKHPLQDFMPIKLNFLAGDDQLKNFASSLLPVNAVVFAQGITNYDFLGSQSSQVIDEIIKVNLENPIKLTKLLESQLLKQEHSRIVYLGSVYGGQGSAMEAVYSATKGGISRFAQAYAREVAASRFTVNVVAPGAVNTAMNAMFSPETLKELAEEIPAGHLAKPKEIAYWVDCLLNPESDYLTGQTIYVSGGWLE
ncbi:elongation factor P 5-aminopentanone reductase [Lactobacillus delbrueckii]|uniref:elongation factor P 5-aminopentanone reductase n=1 Tax=Lactobacillus delbrueckii TaxID=1584 RepID=UPI0022E468B2|nr:SDR family NAD(P)-dependent oxidoreductase [Lactobacillus delbrueckii]